MSPLKFFASIRERRRRSEEKSYEQGAQILRRLQELLATPTPTQETTAVPFTNTQCERPDWLPRRSSILLVKPVREATLGSPKTGEKSVRVDVEIPQSHRRSC